MKVIDFVNARRGSLPVILVGDFNAEPGGTVVNTITQNTTYHPTLAMPDAKTCCLGPATSHARYFDLPFYSGGPKPLFAPWTKNNGPVSGASCALSDHAMVLTRFAPL
jgi:endonuclease/exonuclease/phosphatase (EEP) superfamily protein YafD